MAMNVGSGGRDDDPIMDINTTPLIDVMLVLLVMLIITIPIQLHSVNLNMPTGNPPPPLVKPEVLKIDIDGNGVIYFNGEVIPDRTTVETKFKAYAEQNGFHEAVKWRDSGKPIPEPRAARPARTRRKGD